MRIALLDSNIDFFTGEQTTHRWADVFKQKYVETVIGYEEAKTYKGDAIVSFGGRPDLPNTVPPKEFKGTKVVHLMDFYFYPKEANENLVKNETDYVLGYADHSAYSNFFKDFYPDYTQRLIAVPFGFDRRFLKIKEFSQRKNMCVGLGAVNPIDEGIPDLYAYKMYYQKLQWAQPWRNTLRSKHAEHLLDGLMDSFFPEPSLHGHKRFDYNIVDVYNDYKMFTTCESINGFPSVKTYEGMACGAVFVGNYHPCYRDIGLVDGYNCILHVPNDFEDFVRQLRYYRTHPEDLERIANAGRTHALENFTPEKVAVKLYEKLFYLSSHA